ncbi:hypothetical protein [Actinomadura sp. 3N407]|uniref:hypothetical protein n=1 Tax=Actinomadura sp. 3N407 TaxID=3457423 RepID=UPI003FCD5FBE
MSVRIPTIHGLARPVACRHRTALGAHTVPTATTRFSDDDMLLFLLISTWELHTARPAPAVPPVEMTEQELIEYWSDPTDQPCPPDCLARHPARHPAWRSEPSA